METRPITDLFTNSDEEIAVGLKLLEAHRFWNKKRLSFNIIVGTAGLLSVLFFFGLKFNVFDILGIIVWGLLAKRIILGWLCFRFLSYLHFTRCEKPCR